MIVPRRTWTAPLITRFGGTDFGPVTNGFYSLTEYLRGHVGFWGSYTGTTDANGGLVISHNCGFTPSVAFVQALYDGTSPRNHYGPIHIESLNENDLTIHILRANGTNDASSTRTIFYHILPVVKER